VVAIVGEAFKQAVEQRYFKIGDRDFVSSFLA